MAMPAEEIELRCPVPLHPDQCHGGNLLAILHAAGGKPSFVHPDNLIELPCPDCKRKRRKRGENIRAVLHRYDLAGELIETLVLLPND
jgi:hypothetical protein